MLNFRSQRNIGWYILLAGCMSCSNKLSQTDISFKDTLYKNQILAVDKGDTVLGYEMIYFKPVDTLVVKSNFYYTVSKDYNDENVTYKVYFNRDSVVVFCDSVLKTFPPESSNGWDPYFNERAFYKEIRQQAIENDMGTTEMADELGILLERFKPYIINEVTGHKPLYVIVTHISETVNASKLSEYRTQVFKAKNGDTVHLSLTDIQPIAIDTSSYQ